MSETVTGFVLIAEDHPMISIVLSDLLTDLLGDKATIEVTNSCEGARGISETPDLIVLDLNLVDSEGAETITNFQGIFPNSTILVCSGDTDQALLDHIESLSLAYINKTSAYPKLYAAMEAALRSCGLIESPVRKAERVQQSEHHSNVYAPGSDKPLTLKQVDIMRKTAEGLSAKEVARELGISPDTVRGHMKEIFLRLGAKNKGQAVDIFSKAERQARLLDDDQV